VQFRDEAHGGDGVDATEAAQRADRLGVCGQLAGGLDLLFEPAQTLLDLLDRQQVVFEHHLVCVMLEAQAAQPEPMALAPGLLAAVPDPAPAQQHLAQPMPAAHEILGGVFASAAQIAYRFVLRRGRMDLGQKPRAEPLSQLASVTPIRLDPIAWLARDQRRRDHDADGARHLDPSLQRVAAGTCFVAEAHLARRHALDLPDHPPHRRLLVRQLPLHGLQLSRQKHRQLDGDLVRVHSYEGDTLLHDRLLSYAALVAAVEAPLTRDATIASRSFHRVLTPVFDRPGRSPGASVETMKRASKAVPDVSEDLRSEYAFDYSKAKNNPYAARLKGRTVAVVLEPDVAAAFPNSKAVNRQLRAVVRAAPRRSRLAPRRRDGRTRG
jgi:hypothetical protein